MCLPCGHEWDCVGPMRFRQIAEGTKIFRVETINGYEFLNPEGETPGLVLNRCCSQILIQHGPAIMMDTVLPLQFDCPVCKTPWIIKWDPMLTPCLVFEKAGEQVRFSLVEETSVPFLRPVQGKTAVV